MNAFDQAGLTVNKSILEEIFEILSEKFSLEDERKVLSIKYI